MKQIVIGSFIARSPHTTTAKSGIEELSVAVEIFEKAALHSSRGRAGLVRAQFSYLTDWHKLIPMKNVVRKMRDQAVQAVEEYKKGLFSRPTHDLTEDELCLFGGQTRLLNKSAERSSAPPIYGYGYADLGCPPLTDDFGLGSVYGEMPGPSRAPPAVRPYQTRVEPPVAGAPTYDMFLPRYEPPVQIFIPEYVPENPADPLVQSEALVNGRGHEPESTSAAEGQWLLFMQETGMFDDGSHIP